MNRYTPDPATAASFAAYKQVKQAEAALREPTKLLAVAELRKQVATVGQIAELSGLDPEILRRLAREAGIPLRRPPTRGPAASKNPDDADKSGPAQ